MNINYHGQELNIDLSRWAILWNTSWESLVVRERSRVCLNSRSRLASPSAGAIFFLVFTTILTKGLLCFAFHIPTSDPCLADFPSSSVTTPSSRFRLRCNKTCWLTRSDSILRMMEMLRKMQRQTAKMRQCHIRGKINMERWKCTKTHLKQWEGMRWTLLWPIQESFQAQIGQKWVFWG